MRRLEVLDEEKRARIRQMQHCGIRPLNSNDIPFGIRAIQSGIEVDGIWISRPETHDCSQIASSTTLVTDTVDAIKCKGKSADIRAGHHWRPSTKSRTARTSSEQTCCAEGYRSPRPGYTEAIPLDQQLNTIQLAAEVRPESPVLQVESYMPTGPHNESKSVDRGSGVCQRDLVGKRSHQPQGRIDFMEIPANVELRRPTGNRMSYGVAEVYANRSARRVNVDFEVLPAGLLGPRHDLQDLDLTKVGEHNANSQAQQVPAKLRKKQP